MMVENNGYLRRRILMISLLLTLSAGAAFAQTTSFTYQGRLTDSGTAANGNYDLQFGLFDSAQGVAQIGVTQTISNVSVSAGIFTVQLDFGANAFPGAPRFLEIGARLSGTVSFITLAPRQQITSTPYAVRSLNASSADTVTVNGVPGGSGNYIQNNPASPQAGNFNISGNGTAGGTLSANVVNATTQYNIGGSRILSSVTSNLFAGSNAGVANTIGNRNSFFGSVAGAANTEGGGNSFFGRDAGEGNTLGGGNSFFGAEAGSANNTGSGNTIIGNLANVGSGALTNATAIGGIARVDQSNALVLGSIAGVSGATVSVNVGIGTTAPSYPLDVVGSAGVNATAGVVEFANAGPNTGVRITNTSAGGRVWTLFSSGTGSSIGVGNFSIYDVSPNEPRLSIDPSGNVGIGTTAPTAKLSVNGTANKPGGGSWDSFSDERLKDIKGQFNRGLKAVMQLQPIRYEYKRNNALDLNSDGEHVGFGAQAVQKLIPEAVTQDEKGYLLVNNDPIMWAMLNAIKEQQSQIETLRAQNAALNARLPTVEKVLRKKAGSARRRH